LQLLADFSSLAILRIIGPGAPDGVPAVEDGVWVVTDVRADTVPRPIARCSGFCGLATCFGASTVMVGSGAAEPVAVCDIAVPLRPHRSSAIGVLATAGLATKSDENLMAILPLAGTANSIP